MNFGEKKNGIRESDDKKFGMWDSREKGAGMRDQDPPLPDPDYFHSLALVEFTKLI